jgi:hypothetical protein
MVKRRALLWSFLATAALVIAAVFWLRHRLTQPDQWEERIGGNWRLHHMRWAASHSLHTDLLHGDGEIVAKDVNAWKYYGDDCLAYGALAESEHYYFVCGHHRPFAIGGDVPTAWTFEADAVRERGIENSSTALASGTRVLHVTDLKSAALRTASR